MLKPNTNITRPFLSVIKQRIITVIRRLKFGTIVGGDQKDKSAAVMANIFTNIYRRNYWGNEDSRSGAGSDMEQTAAIREYLPKLLRHLEAKSMLDIPCGDFHWMKDVPLNLDYTGADIVHEIIERNQTTYFADNRHFLTANLTTDKLPTVDAVFCRDVLVHFSLNDVFQALDNIISSGSTYLITTTFVDRDENPDIITGQWRALNLQSPPFNFPAPIELINEECSEGDGSWSDKSLGVWRILDLGELRHKQCSDN